MADKKEYKFHLATTGDPSGAKEVEKAIDGVTEATESLGTTTSGGTQVLTTNLHKSEEAAQDLEKAIRKTDDAIDDLSEPRPLPVDPKVIKPAEGSLAALTAEVQRLQRELEEVPVGGKAFTDLAGRLKSARTALSDADAQAKKLAGTMGRGGNAGMAVLEFSRAFEDAQYGMRGVLNNIPGLIAMLGGGAGLAGALSVAAVLGTQLWEKLGSSKDADEALEAIGEAAEKLAGKLKTLRDRRMEVEKMPTADLTRPLKEEDTAFKLQTQIIRANIEAIKDRINIAAGLDAALTQGALGAVDIAERDGKITADQATEQRDAIKKAAKEREITRTNELAKLDETVAIEAKEAARRELMLAEFKKNAASERLKEAQEEEAAMKAEQKKRNEINAVRAALDAARADFDKLNIGDLPADNETLQKLQQGAANEQKLAEATGGDASENITVRLAAALEKLLAAESALPAVEAGKNPRGLDELESEGKKLTEAISKMKDSVREAEELITAKTADLKLAEQSATIAQERGQERAQGRSDQRAATDLVDAQGAAQEAEQRAADQVGKLLDDVLSALGNAASAPQVQDKATALRALLEGGLQRSEADQSQALLQQLIGKMDSGDTKRGELYLRMLQTMEREINNLATLAGRVDDLDRRVSTLSDSVRGAMPGN